MICETHVPTVEHFLLLNLAVQTFEIFINAVLKMAILSKPSNPLAIAGSFQPNPNLDRLVKYLNSVPGTDKVLMVRFRKFIVR